MAKKETVTSEKIKVHARAAFVRLDKPKAFEEGQDPRWECTFLLDPADAKGRECIANVIKIAAQTAKRAYGLVPLELKKLGHTFGVGPAPDAKEKDDGIEVAFYPGDRKEYDGFAGQFVIPAHNKVKPAIANRKGESVLPGEEQFPYSGCYVVGSITLWCQDNRYGKRIGVNLRGVQFARDGKAFGLGSIDPEDEFEAMEDADTATEGAEEAAPW